MTGRAPVTLPWRPLVVTVGGEELKVTVLTARSTTTITTSASNGDGSHACDEVDANAPAPEDTITPKDRQINYSNTSSEQDGSKKDNTRPLDVVPEHRSPTQPISQPSTWDSMVTSARFKLMTSADYRDEGLLPLLSITMKEPYATIEDCLYRVYAIGLQNRKFVIYCDIFTFRQAPFLNMPSVVSLQRLAQPLSSAGTTARISDRETSSRIYQDMGMGLPLIITSAEMESRGCYPVGGIFSPDYFINMVEATAAWQQEYLPDTTGEDIVKRVAGLETHAIREIVAEAQASKI